MALGDAMQKRMAELAKRQAALPGRLAAIAEGHPPGCGGGGGAHPA